MAGPWGCPRLHAAGIGEAAGGDGGGGGCGCGCRNNNGGGGAIAAAAAAAGGDDAGGGGCDGVEAVAGRASPPLKAAGTPWLRLRALHRQDLEICFLSQIFLLLHHRVCS